MAIVKPNAIIATHKVTKSKFTFVQHVNPKNTDDYFFRSNRNLFNGKRYSMEMISAKFDVVSINLYSDKEA